MRKSFQELFWKCKSIKFKKIKIIAEPVAAMAAGRGGPAAARGATAGKFLRQTKAGPKAGPSLERNPSNRFQKPLEVQWKLALGLSEEAP